MSRRPIALSPDLTRLQNEGYDIFVRNGFLIIKDVPYVDADKTVKRGILISKLKLSADITDKPDDHVAYWSGTHPHHANGVIMAAIQNPSPSQDLGIEITADFTFSAKADYRDYHHKMLTYIGAISGEASVIDPEVSAKTYPPIPTEDADQNVFNYIDTSSSRAGIGIVNSKIKGQKIAIIGLGGTGAYILDIIAKTAVAEIHIIDGDIFSQHNAFRAPGAPSIEQLTEKPKKVAYYKSIYDHMRSNIIAHEEYLDEKNLHLLSNKDFVFIAMDRGSSKRVIVDYLKENNIPFVEAGMGVVLEDNQLAGIVRTTTSLYNTREKADLHISFSDGDGEVNEYSSNIQIAELNSLNAAFAVIRWKKVFGIYRDTRNEYTSGFSIPSGEIAVESLT